ncbi:hypothetical protein BGX34_003657 [Mortierella sp. NVP85]|nr:hypothetical protein BGX34_003657 [Mortierella sp. NVP85]
MCKYSDAYYNPCTCSDGLMRLHWVTQANRIIIQFNEEASEGDIKSVVSEVENSRGKIALIEDCDPKRYIAKVSDRVLENLKAKPFVQEIKQVRDDVIPTFK